MQSDFAFFGFLFGRQTNLAVPNWLQTDEPISVLGWKEQFFRWWYDYSVKVPVPRDDYNLHMAEPFDFGYRMSNLVSKV